MNQQVDFYSIEAIGKRMISQGNFHLQNPLFAIYATERAYGHEDSNVFERKEDYDSDDLCEGCQRKIEDDEELGDYCEDCPYEMFLRYKEIEGIDDKAGVFLTAAAAQRHIDENKHHYENPRVYAIPAWRNPEMQAVMRFICSQSGGEIPDYYK